MSLRAFLEQMEEKKEMIHIKDSVSINFEIAYIMKSFDGNGPVLLFENVEDAKARIVANVCGTRKRICEALNVDQDRLYKRLLEAWQSPRKPRIVDDGPVKEVIEEPDLLRIPVLTHFERDANPYITAAVVHAKSLDGNIENVSVHRLQVLDERHLAIRLVPRHLYKLWNMAKEAETDLDIAIAIGVHPAVMLAAASPLPFGVCEFDVANALLNDQLHLVECKYVNACAPADAELVLEGRISASKEVIEGPFVDITGTYDIQRKQPVVEVVNVMHRKDYIYQALLPSGSEHKLLMGMPFEAAIYEAVSKVVPKVNAVNLSIGGNGWLHAIISIEKQMEGDAKNALLAAFAAHPSLKHAVVVDSDINVFDLTEVEWAIATRFQACEDLLVIQNARGSTLDASANQETGLTSKMGIDATRPLSKPKEKFEKARIPTSKRVEELLQKLRRDLSV
ncbi:MAG: UbiD family decarboxylase [Candidatus Bathyarchaeia archaeon]